MPREDGVPDAEEGWRASASDLCGSAEYVSTAWLRMAEVAVVMLR